MLLSSSMAAVPVLRGWLVSGASSLGVHRVARLLAVRTLCPGRRIIGSGPKRRGLVTTIEHEPRGAEGEGGGGRRVAEEGGGVGLTHPETFASRLLSLLRQGRAAGFRGGVGSSGPEEIARARSALLGALEGARDHHLSPEVRCVLANGRGFFLFFNKNLILNEQWIEITK